MATNDRMAALDAAFDALLGLAEPEPESAAGPVAGADLAILRRLQDGWRQPAPDPVFVRRLGANLAAIHGRTTASPNAAATTLTGARPSFSTAHGTPGEPWAPRRVQRFLFAAAALIVCVALVATALLGRDGERRETIPAAAVASPPSTSRAIVLMIDVSGSMSYDPLGGTTRIAAEQAAAQSVLARLAPGDWFGVLAFNDQQTWAVPLAPLAGFDERDEAATAIDSIIAERGTEPYPALLAAIEALENAPPLDRHLVVFSDGKGRTGTPEEYRLAALSAAGAGIVISTVALGADAETDLLQTLAEVGGGRYHYAERTEDIPSGVGLILGFTTATPEPVPSGDGAEAATPELESAAPAGVRSAPVAVSITVDGDGLLRGDDAAEEQAIADLRTAFPPLAAAGCRIGFVITEGSAPDIGIGNQTADLVNKLIRTEFPDMVDPVGTGFFSFANVTGEAGPVTILVFPNLGCEVGAGSPSL